MTEDLLPRSVREELRALCDRHGVPVEQRGRLVLAAATLVRALAPAAPTVTSEVRGEPDGGATLEVVLRLDRAPTGRHPPLDLPLPAEVDPDGAVTWRIALPATGTRGARAGAAEPAGALEALEEELRAALARVDTLEREHRELKHELAETNSGVLAMVVELEERDERLRGAHAAIFRELEDALRPPPLTVPGLEMGVHYQPAEADAPSGGDLYDWFTMPDGTVHVSIVDAVGHGVACTRAAVTVSHTLRTLALEGHPLDVLVRRTAEIVPDRMATVLLARLDPRTGLARLANGGHPPALLVPADGGEPAYLPVRGRGVGFPAPGSQGVREVRLARGDTLLLYTDGLTESRGDHGEGEHRLVAAARHHRTRPAAAMATAVVGEMHDVVVHRDDTLLLTIRRAG